MEGLTVFFLGNSNSSLHVRADILNLLFLDDFFSFFHVY